MKHADQRYGIVVVVLIDSAGIGAGIACIVGNVESATTTQTPRFDRCRIHSPYIRSGFIHPYGRRLRPTPLARYACLL